MKIRVRNPTANAVYLPGHGAIAGGASADVISSGPRDESLREELVRMVEKGLLMMGNPEDAYRVEAAEILDRMGLRPTASAFLGGAFRLVFFFEGRRRRDGKEPFAVGEETEQGTLRDPLRARIVYVDRGPPIPSEAVPDFRRDARRFFYDSKTGGRPTALFCSAQVAELQLEAWEPGDVVAHTIELGAAAGWRKVTS